MDIRTTLILACAGLAAVSAGLAIGAIAAVIFLPVGHSPAVMAAPAVFVAPMGTFAIGAALAWKNL